MQLVQKLHMFTSSSICIAILDSDIGLTCSILEQVAKDGGVQKNQLLHFLQELLYLVTEKRENYATILPLK